MVGARNLSPIPPASLLNDSIVALGEAAHLAPLVHRLSLGKPITMVGIGSSITHRHGGCTRLLDGSACTFRMSGWLRIFFDGLNASYPNPRHRLLNAGIPASAPSAFTECLTWMPESVRQPQPQAHAFIPTCLLPRSSCIVVRVLHCGVMYTG